MSQAPKFVQVSTAMDAELRLTVVALDADGGVWMLLPKSDVWERLPMFREG
jgi:hypothetical protein